MLMNAIKILGIILSLLFICSCNPKIDQNSMFKGRAHKTKKKGIYDAGLNRRVPISIQTAKDIDKLSKHDDNPKKAAKLAEKELEKKKRASQKAREKHNRKRRVKVKTTKGRPGGGGT